MVVNWLDTLKNEGAVKPRQTLSEEAAETLREFILLGKLEPGTAVPERDLAEALGVSRTPLREALRLLENEGSPTSEPVLSPAPVAPALRI